MAEVVRARSTHDRFMGSVLVAKDDVVLFRESSGWANVEWRIPHTAATKFRLGSVTKQFTAAAILRLAEQGKLALDDPLSKFIPAAPETWRPVTLRQLLAHTGGVPSFTDQPDYRKWKLTSATPEDLMRHIADRPLEFPPGEKFKYSNTGYVLLGWVVELASGESYERFLRTQFFEPLGLEDTGYDSNRALLPQRAAGYIRGPKGLLNASFIDMHVPGAAGALYSTTGDMLRWTRALFGGKVLSAASLEQMTTPVRQNYAFGLTVATVKGRQVIAHSGGIDGFNSRVAYYPESKLTVVVLANVEGPEYTQIADDMAALAFGETVTLPAERTAVDVPAAVVQRYVGVYQLTPRITNTIRLTEGGLTTQLTGQPALPLVAESETKFFLRVVDAQVEFFSGADGRVSHLVQYQSGRQRQADRIDEGVPEVRP